MRPKVKAIGLLTPEDFEAHRIWVFCHGLDEEEHWYEECDETSVRPWRSADPLSFDATYLVSASIRFRNGANRMGFLTPLPVLGSKLRVDDSRVEPAAKVMSEAAPCVFLSNGEWVGFWAGFGEYSVDLGALERDLESAAAELFPALATGTHLGPSWVTSLSIPGFRRIEQIRHNDLKNSEAFRNLMDSGRIEEAFELARATAEAHPRDVAQWDTYAWRALICNHNKDAVDAALYTLNLSSSRTMDDYRYAISTVLQAQDFAQAREIATAGLLANEGMLVGAADQLRLALARVHFETEEYEQAEALLAMIPEETIIVPKKRIRFSLGLDWRRQLQKNASSLPAHARRSP